MDELYKEMILDLYRHPLHKGLLSNATHTHKGFNPTCGDEITVQLIVTDGRIKEIMYMGEGCAISQAAISLVADKTPGMTIEEAAVLGKEYIDELLGVEITPTRTKCALLGLETLQKALTS